MRKPEPFYQTQESFKANGKQKQHIKVKKKHLHPGDFRVQYCVPLYERPPNPFIIFNTEHIF